MQIVAAIDLAAVVPGLPDQLGLPTSSRARWLRGSSARHRNSCLWLRRQFLEREAESLGAALEITNYPAAIPLLILSRTGVTIRHTMPQSVLEQHGELAHGGHHSLGFSTAGGKTHRAPYQSDLSWLVQGAAVAPPGSKIGAFSMTAVCHPISCCLAPGQAMM